MLYSEGYGKQRNYAIIRSKWMANPTCEIKSIRINVFRMQNGLVLQSRKVNLPLFITGTENMPTCQSLLHKAIY